MASVVGQNGNVEVVAETVTDQVDVQDIDTNRLSRRLGSVQVLYKHVWGGGGSDQKCLFAYGVRGGWGVLRQNAYITDLNSYSPEKGL